MAAPNLKNPTTITGKTARTPINSSGLTTVLTCSGNSNSVFKINSIFCANIDGTNSADITVTISGSTGEARLASTLTVPADATQIICSKETYFYLEEGNSIRAAASASGDLELVIGYEDIQL